MEFTRNMKKGALGADVRAAKYRLFELIAAIYDQK